MLQDLLHELQDFVVLPEQVVLQSPEQDWHAEEQFPPQVSLQDLSHKDEQLEKQLEVHELHDFCVEPWHALAQVFVHVVLQSPEHPPEQFDEQLEHVLLLDVPLHVVVQAVSHPPLQVV